LASAIYWEARGEDKYGKTNIADVVKNRVKNSKTRETVCGVVFKSSYKNGKFKNKSCSFSWVCDGKPKKIEEKDINEWVSSVKIAATELSSKKTRTKATHFHAKTVKEKPYWTKDMVVVSSNGRNLFYQDKTYSR
jgi:spore germination cell wall hydrolase CwlJ-like protein